MDSAPAGRRRQRLECGFATALLVFVPGPAFAMHIAEGIITGWPVVAYTLIGIALMAIGTRGIKIFNANSPSAGL